MVHCLSLLTYVQTQIAPNYKYTIFGIYFWNLGLIKPLILMCNLINGVARFIIRLIP